MVPVIATWPKLFVYLCWSFASAPSKIAGEMAEQYATLSRGSSFLACAEGTLLWCIAMVASHYDWNPHKGASQNLRFIDTSDTKTVRAVIYFVSTQFFPHAPWKNKKRWLVQLHWWCLPISPLWVEPIMCNCVQTLNAALSHLYPTIRAPSTTI